MENSEFNPVLLMLKKSPQCFSYLPFFLQTRIARLKLIWSSEVFRRYISRNIEKIINIRIKVIEKILPMVIWVLSNNEHANTLNTEETVNCECNDDKEDGECGEENVDGEDVDGEDEDDEDEDDEDEDDEDEDDEDEDDEDEDDEDGEEWNGSLFKVSDYMEFDKYLDGLLQNKKKMENEVLQLAKLLFLSPVYNIIGDRFIVLGTLDDASPVLKALDTFTNSKVAIKVLMNGKFCYDEICKTRLFSTISPEFADIISVEPIAFTESMGSKRNKYKDGKQMPLVIVFPKFSKCLFRQRQDFEDSHKIPYDSLNQLINDGIIEDTSNGKKKSEVSQSAKLVPIELFKKIFYPLSNAFLKLHNAGYIHGDIKLDNIMHSASGIKVIDMGLSKRLDVPLNDTRLYTVGYVPPEIRQPFRKMRLTGKLDVFALGITMLLFVTPSIDEVFTSLSPKQYVSGQRLIHARIQELQLSGKPNLACLLSRMLDFDETKRLTMGEVVQHQFWEENYPKSEPTDKCDNRIGLSTNEITKHLLCEKGTSHDSRSRKDPVSVDSQYLTCVENMIHHRSCYSS